MTSTIRENNNTYQGKIERVKLKAGSLVGKIPIKVNEKTTVFVNPGTNIDEIIKKFTNLMILKP